MNLNSVSNISRVTKLNNQSAGQSESFAKQFVSGQLLRATVLETFENFALLDISGRVVRAKNEADQSLTPGQNIVIRVGQQIDDMLMVKIESDDALAQQQSTDKALNIQLQRLGFPVKESLQNVLRALYEQQLAPSRENVIGLRNEVASFQQIAKQITHADKNATVNWTQSIKEQAIALSKQHEVASQLTASKYQSAITADSEKMTNQLNNPQNTNVLATEMKNATMSTKLEISPTNFQSDSVDTLDQLSNHQQGNFKIKHLTNILTEKFLTIANKSEPYITNLFAAMDKFGVDKTPLNTVLFNQLLTGKLDAFSELFEAIRPARDMLPKQLVQLMDDYNANILNYEDFPEKLDGKAIKEMTEIAKAIQRQLADIKLVSESEHRTEQLAVAQRSVSLLSDQINWQAIHIPVQLKQELRDAEIYIANNHKKGSQFNSDDGLVYIALNTKKLATVRVKLNFKKDLLNIHFVTESDDYSTHIKRFEDALLRALEPLIERRLTVTYSTDEADFNLAEMAKVEPVRLAAFDHKV